MDSFDGYLERFNAAYAEQPHKWEASSLQSWEVEVYRDFDYAEDRLSVYGRFGVIPAWLLQ